jgi:hypothetical protein
MPHEDHRTTFPRLCFSEISHKLTALMKTVFDGFAIDLRMVPESEG